ncbi:predicted protein [Histoplasma capsulatum H143]|uniref:Uncharacterized protein n=1 Tax=Ajellomyces capsulatus (strain H143) TaxID=544712 RepID=C6H5B3_AJECH|nr:predicted protein [Histoplasma capsulatum H143]
MGGASTRHAAIPQVGTPYFGSRPDYRFLRPWLAKGLAISKRGMGKGGNLGNGRGNSRTGTSVDGRYRRAKQGQLLPVRYWYPHSPPTLAAKPGSNRLYSAPPLTVLGQRRL